MANCLCFKDLVLVSESQSDNDYTRFIGGVHPIFCRFLVVWLNVGNPGQTNLCMFIGRIYKPITFLHDPSRRDKSWIAALFSGVFCLRCFLFVLYCFFFHFPTHALLSASWCFFLVALLTEISGTCGITPKLTSRVFLEDVISYPCISITSWLNCESTYPPNVPPSETMV